MRDSSPRVRRRERATIGQLIQLGAINPQDPEQQWTILKKFGETDIKGSVDVDTRKAIKEQEEFLKNGVPPKIKPGIQNSQIHLASIRNSRTRMSTRSSHRSNRVSGMLIFRLI
jgi:hypothetical protein